MVVEVSKPQALGFPPGLTTVTLKKAVAPRTSELSARSNDHLEFHCINENSMQIFLIQIKVSSVHVKEGAVRASAGEQVQV